MGKHLGFQDERLQTRLERITELVEKDPASSFPQLCGESDLEALYRFLANTKVNPAAILESHFRDIRAAAASENDVLILHDTTHFSFLSEIGSRPNGFYAHFSLAVCTKGYRRPLGVTNMLTWVRDGTRDEYSRWFDCVQESAERFSDVSQIHVMDREADDYKLFAQMCEGNHRFVVRLTHRHRLLEHQGGTLKLETSIGSIQSSAEREVKLTRRDDRNRRPRQQKIHPARNTRAATLSCGAQTVVFRRPEARTKEKREALAQLPERLPVNIVRVWEEHPPEGEPAVEWLLITSEPISTSSEVLKVVDHYRTRWTIEEYFKALKTGCAFEKRQISDYEGLCNALAVFVPIANKALALRSLARDEPDGEALLLDEDELSVLREGGRTKLSSSPTNRNILLAIAALGGHLKRSGDPGWLTISRGLSKLESLVTGWRLAKLQQLRDQR